MVEYVYLKNVAGIYNGLDLEEIEIRFNDNKFNLVCGDNGSGKSTLTDALSPFATEIIRKDRKGKKIIILKAGKDRYEIKHFYEPTNTGHSVKSFITKIDKHGVRTDLNQNGNVTSFKEIVHIELGLSESSIQLFKLGRDLGSIIDMSPLKRKAYMTQFTSQADVYIILHKKIAEDARLLKKLLDNTTDKLNNIGDVDVINKRLSETNETLNVLEEKERSLNNELSVLKERSNIILSENDRRELIELSNEIYEVQQKRDMYDISSEYTKLNKEQLTFKIESLKTNVFHNSGIIDLLKSNKSALINDLNEVKNKIYSIDEQIDVLNYDDSYTDDIDSMIEQLESDNRSMKKDYNQSDRYKYLDKEFLKKTIDTFDKLTEEIYAISDELNNSDLQMFEYGKDYDVMYRQAVNNSNNMANQILELENELKSFEYADDLNNRLKLQPNDCYNKKCPFILEIMEKMNNIDLVKLDNIHKKINRISKEKNNIDDNVEVLWNLNRMSIKIDNLFKVIDSLDEILVQDAILTKDKILRNVLKSKFVFIDKDKIMNIIQLLDIRDEYIANTSKIERLHKLEIDFSKIINLNAQKEDLQKREKNISVKLNEAVNKLDEFIIDTNNMKSELEQLIDYLKIKDKLDRLDSKIKRMNDLNERMETVNELNKNINTIEKYDLQKIRDMKQVSLKDRDKLMVKRAEAKKLKKYKKVVVENYNDIDMMRKALSTKEGIPLLFISLLLEKTRNIANDILIDAFDNTIKLDKFKINAKEFRIPLVGKGDENEDISRASAGERAIISLALSLALTKQAGGNNRGSNYDLLTLDEVDGPLDVKRRRSFLRLLDRQTNIMGIKQVVSISHNNMFSDYPVNLILLKGADINVMKDANILYQY